MKTVEEIRIENEHTFNNWGAFDIVINGRAYPAKWDGHKKELETDAPEDAKRRVYDYLFGEEGDQNENEI